MVGQGRKRKVKVEVKVEVKEEDVDEGGLPTGLATPPPKQKRTRKQAASTKTETPPPTVKPETAQAPPTPESPPRDREQTVPLPPDPPARPQVVVPDRRISYCDCGRRARRLYCRNGRPENIGKYYYICTNLNTRVEPRCEYWHWVESVADAIRRERVHQNRMMGYWYGPVPEMYPQFDPDGDELDDWF